mgnify:CR=1 FL=1|jgi:hypothetical protein
MEYVISPVILVLVLRFAFPALVTWFFERFVEPKAEIARKKINSDTVIPTEIPNAQKIEAARKGLDELKYRLEKTGR